MVDGLRSAEVVEFESTLPTADLAPPPCAPGLPGVIPPRIRRSLTSRIAAVRASRRGSPHLVAQRAQPRRASSSGLHMVAARTWWPDRRRDRACGWAGLPPLEPFDSARSGRDASGRSAFLGRCRRHPQVRGRVARGGCPPPALTEPDLWISHPALRDTGVARARRTVTEPCHRGPRPLNIGLAPCGLGPVWDSARPRLITTLGVPVPALLPQLSPNRTPVDRRPAVGR